MPQSVFALTSKMNPVVLSRLMELQQWREMSFGRWVGPEFIKAAGRNISTPVQPTGPQWTGAPIEVHKEFVSVGKTDMDIPVRNILKGRPVFGDRPLKGTGEGAVVTYRSVPINYTRKAYDAPTGMSEQIIKQYADQLVSNANDQLKRWWSDYHPGNFMLAMLAGYSYDLLSPATLGGRAKTTISHPNFYTAGGGKVGYGGGKPGSAGYETAVANALDGLTNVPEDKMTVALLRNLRVEANRLKITPIVVASGYKFFAVWISDAQWVQLQADPEYRELMKTGQVPLDTNPLVTAAKFQLEGVCVYVDQSLFGARTAASDATVTATVEYGPSPSVAERAEGHLIGNWIENRDTNDRKVGLLVGESCMSVGIGKDMQMTEEIDDHGFVKEFGVNTIQSVVRSDIFDKDGKKGTAGDFDENTSSLAFGTFSTDGLTWS